MEARMPLRRSAANKGDGLPVSLWHAVDEARTAPAAHSRTIFVLAAVSSTNTSGRDQTCPVLASSAGAPAPRLRVAARLLVGFF
jgi:hypothetical protein